MEEQPFLRRLAQGALLPCAVRLEDTQLREQLAHERGTRARHRHVVRGPRIRRHFVRARSRVAAGFRIHLEQRQIGQAELLQPPRGRQPGDAAADDDDRYTTLFARRGERRAVAQAVADGLRLVYEAARDRGSALARQAREGDGLQEPATGDVSHSRIVVSG
jgi:hypothetical protein